MSEAEEQRIRGALSLARQAVETFEAALTEVDPVGRRRRQEQACEYLAEAWLRIGPRSWRGAGS